MEANKIKVLEWSFVYIDEQHDGDALKCSHALLYIKHGLIKSSEL